MKGRGKYGKQKDKGDKQKHASMIKSKELFNTFGNVVIRFSLESQMSRSLLISSTCVLS